jgi:hypothetical protein
MIDNGMFGGFFFWGVDSMGITRWEVHTAVGGDEGEGNGIFREEMV